MEKLSSIPKENLWVPCHVVGGHYLHISASEDCSALASHTYVCSFQFSVVIPTGKHMNRKTRNSFLGKETPATWA
ncbi:hypothetical protein VNO77_05422 [Canavalia gladiata]|uniref:Uncharacterized protein n=1 Tax=Canavalia gladiata TaxID=3824 RepID=A0AAN9MZ10_CANGL